MYMYREEKNFLRAHKSMLADSEFYLNKTTAKS